MSNLWNDLRFGLRMLARRPGFTVVAMLTLALGIGANTAIFSVVEALLLRPLPYRDPNRLVMVWEHNYRRNQTEYNSVGPSNYMRWKEQVKSFESMSLFTAISANILPDKPGEADAERLPIGIVSADLFQTIGVGPILGRTIEPDDGRPGHDGVVVISHGYWMRHFGGDLRVTERSLRLNDQRVQILGVMPPRFQIGQAVDLWTPIVLTESTRDSMGRWASVVARLKPGVSQEQAQAEMSAIAQRFEQERPAFDMGWTVHLRSMRDEVSGDIRTPLLVLLGAVGFVLLIACANVANLQLARAAGRRKELAVRAALGAGRGRLLAQFLAESVTLALAGGAAGLVLAMWMLSIVGKLLPSEIPGFVAIDIDAPVMTFALALSCASGLIFGIAPALQASRSDPQHALQEGGRGASASRASGRLRNVLVASEMALALILLAGAGILMKSFMRLSSVNPGFAADRLLTMEVALSGERYDKAPAQARYFADAISRISTQPGVISAAAMSFVPLTGLGSATNFSLADRPKPPEGEEPVGDVRVVTAGLFRTMGIPILQGREFEARDTANSPIKVIINENMAKTYWPNESPLGKHVLMEWYTKLDAEIIGVAGDVRLTSLDTKAGNTLYWAQPQFPNAFMAIMVRTQGAPLTAAPAVKTQLAGLDPETPVAKIQTMEQVAGDSLKQSRFTMLLLAIFAALALVLAALGIYGVISYLVTLRTREIGVRMALGARPADVLGMVIRQAMVTTSIGLLAGLAGALILSRSLTKLLYEVQPADPATFAAVSVALAVVSLAACAIPARRATRVDPMTALHHE
jgi:putative ABC transport system permease protein